MVITNSNNEIGMLLRKVLYDESYQLLSNFDIMRLYIHIEYFYPFGMIEDKAQNH